MTVATDYFERARERRFRILEMADGILETAMMLEQWVETGRPPGVEPVVIKPKISVPGVASEPAVVQQKGVWPGRIPDDDGLDIPPALDRRVKA